MNYHLNGDGKAAVAVSFEYQPMTTCPLGKRIVGLSKGGVARIDEVGSLSKTDLIAWAPLPRRPQWLNKLEGRS